MFFGTPLFEPLGRGIRLTPAGHVLLERARRLLVNTDDLTREMSDLAQGLAGQVSVGLVPTAAQHLLPALCRVFLADAKDVSLKASIGQSNVLKEALKAGDLDLVISYVTDAQTSVESDFVAFPFLEDAHVVVARKSHEIFRKSLRMKDLLDHRWVLAHPGVEGRMWLEKAFETCGLPKPQVAW